MFFFNYNISLNYTILKLIFSVLLKFRFKIYVSIITQLMDPIPKVFILIMIM
jgi:hypothetical protein